VTILWLAFWLIIALYRVVRDVGTLIIWGVRALRRH
jgi:hypothetical protein